jgi:hypothetical protein
MFKVRPATVRTWIHGGLFPNAVKMGTDEKSQWFVPRSDIAAKAQKEYGS